MQNRSSYRAADAPECALEFTSKLARTSNGILENALFRILRGPVRSVKSHRPIIHSENLEIRGAENSPVSI